MPETIYAARKVITMDPARPAATHVAVRDGAIAAVGTADEARRAAPGARIDDRFAGAVLMPGLVEAHAHTLEGGYWLAGAYVGAIARSDADGRRYPALRTADDVVAALVEVERGLDDPGRPLLGWGADPILFTDGSDLSAAHLDRVSTDRPVVVVQASGHVLYVNHAALRRAQLTPDVAIEGIMRERNGEPTGELREIPAMMPVVAHVVPEMLTAAGEPEALRITAAVAARAGVTTVADMGSSVYFDPAGLRAAREVTADPRFPVRIVALAAPLVAGIVDVEEGIERTRALRGAGHEHLRFGPVKLILDGSIQGFSARLLEPRYLGTGANGLWNMVPEQFRTWVERVHAEGWQLHCHCNGDEAGELFIEAVAGALAAHPRADHRHTMQHAQLTSREQFARMAELGMAVNLFTNHLFYWGDAHVERTVGLERAQRMNACRSAAEAGVPFAFHSDAPITPIAPLFSAWCAVNRTTSSGRVLGAHERITVPEALRAATLGAAYTLRLEHEIGSLEAGKRADLTVLGEDPLSVDPAALRDVPILGTVLSGRVVER